MEIARGSFLVLTKHLRLRTPPLTVQMTPAPAPRHAFQKASTVDAMVVVIVNDPFRQMPPAMNVNELLSQSMTPCACVLFPKRQNLWTNAGYLFGNKA
jgi:hypothetical protein